MKQTVFFYGFQSLKEESGNGPQWGNHQAASMYCFVQNDM